MSRVVGRLPPAGDPIRPAQLARLLRGRHDTVSLAEALATRLGVRSVALHASGREAMRAALAALAARTGRREVVIPAYTCFSVPASAVAAGLRVRLVDQGERAAIDPAALARLPLERAAAVVVTNLFGFAEPIGEVARLARAAGACVVDDAAQAFGAACEGAQAGTRGDLGVLSFGRGKPLSALGGGALVAPEGAPPAPERSAGGGPLAGLRALARAAAWDAALAPAVFAALARVPALGIGETRFDPGFARGGIDPAAAALASAVLPDVDAAARARAADAARLAAAVESASALRALRAWPQDVAVFPRLALLAPSGEARDRAIERLAAVGAGATTMYPSTLAEIVALEPELEGTADCPGARDFAARLLTLPVNGSLRGARLEAALAALAEA